MRRWLGLGAALLVVLVLGCTKREQKAEYGLPLKDTLRINVLQEPPSLDWSKSTDTTSSLIENNIMEGLVEYDLNDPELGLVPGLATEWRPSNNAQTWTFVIRKGVKWTDGVDFTGQHVIDGWERILNAATASEYAYFLFGVKNAQAYNQGKIKDFSQVGVKLTADGNLVVELEQPKSYFPYLMAHHSTFPLRKDVIAKHGDRWTDPANIVTLGAYKLKIWEHDKALVLERNDLYHGEKAKTKYVLAYMINEMSTAINLFDSKKLDFQYSLPSRELRQLRQRKEYRESGILGIYYYGFNVRKPPFNDPRVRKAFAMGVDRKQVTEMLAGGQIPLSGWIPAGMFGYESDRGLKFNVEEANKLLDQAGYKDRSRFPKIKLGFNTNEDHQRVAENVQAQIKKNLGIDIEMANEEWKVYLATLRSNTPAIFRLGWLADYPDPDNFMNLMASYSENNHTGWKNKKYDDQVSKAVSITDKEKRRKVYSDAQKMLTEDEVPAWPIYSMVSQVLIDERVKGLKENAMNRYLFKTVSLQ
ncbi:MAG: peptide ABC transporter substrate-binding protein [Bdellovibrionales bacterium]